MSITLPSDDILSRGWWIGVSPMAERDKWICAVYREGKVSWITEACKTGFNDPIEAYDWGMKFINQDYISIKKNV